jgi:hypothetical protein
MSFGCPGGCFCCVLVALGMPWLQKATHQLYFQLLPANNVQIKHPRGTILVCFGSSGGICRGRFGSSGLYFSKIFVAQRVICDVFWLPCALFLLCFGGSGHALVAKSSTSALFVCYLQAKAQNRADVELFATRACPEPPKHNKNNAQGSQKTSQITL